MLPWDLHPKLRPLRSGHKYILASLNLPPVTRVAICGNYVVVWFWEKDKFTKKLCFLSFSGKSRIYIFSNFYLRVRHEDHSLRFLATWDSLPTECLEFARFYYRHDRVSCLSLLQLVLQKMDRKWALLKSFFIAEWRPHLASKLVNFGRLVSKWAIFGNFNLWTGFHTGYFCSKSAISTQKLAILAKKVGHSA